MSGRERSGDLHVGGQAVIEGVVMRSPRGIVAAVRADNGKGGGKALSFSAYQTEAAIAALKTCLGDKLLARNSIIN